MRTTLLIIALGVTAASLTTQPVPAQTVASQATAPQPPTPQSATPQSTSAQSPAETSTPADPSAEDAAQSRIDEAERALESQNNPHAIVLLKQLAIDDPDDARVFYDLGFAEEHTSDDAAAAAAYARAIAIDPSLPQPQLALGLLDARSGRGSKAHGELTAVAKNEHASPQLRGRALRALARLDADAAPALAADELLSAVQLTGQQSDDAELSAQLAEQSGDTSGAETAYRKALAANPDDLDAAAGLARVLKLQGHLPDAETVLTEAMDRSPANAADPRLVAQLATVYVAEGKDAQAIPLLETLRANSPSAAKDPVLTEMLARIDALNNRLPDAEVLYRQLLSTTPSDPSLLDSLGGVLIKEGRNDEAVALLKQAVGMRAEFHDDTAWAEAASHLAFAASRDHQPGLCLQALRQRATVLPSSPASLFLDATAHDALHQNGLAIDQYKAFLAVAGGHFPDEEFEARHRVIALEHEK